MVESVAVIMLMGTLIIGIISAYWHNRQKKYLLTHIAVDNNIGIKAKKLLENMGLEGQVAVGITIFDVFYNSIKIDPFALRGIDHLHHSQNFENLGQLVSFMKESIIKDSDGADLRQIIHKYKGYTGEEHAFETLRASGSHIEIPESGTWPGADVYIDGDPVNIKITDNPAYIAEHFRDYPDISVYTNVEMQQAYADHSNVIIDPDLSSQDMFHTTADSIDGISHMGDWIDRIPVITLALSTAKNGKQWLDGKKDFKTAGEHIICDTTAVGVGSMAGGKIGLMVGMALVPATGGVSAIVIPTITTMIGSIMGIMSGKSLVNWFKQRHLRAAIDQLKTNAANYCEAFYASANDVVQKVVKPCDTQSNYCRKQLDKGKWWPLRALFPSLAEKFYYMAIDNIDKEKDNIRQYYQNLLKLLREKKTDEAGLLLYAQGECVVAEDGGLLYHYHCVEQAIKKVEQERTKLC